MASNQSAGVFAGIGGDIIIMVDIVPDPAIIQSQLLEAAGNLENTLLPMEAARRVAQEDIQAHFDSESDPGGDKWTALDASYAEYKESLGYPSDILHREGTLEEAATSKAAFTVTPYGLWFNWNVLPRAKSDGSNYGQIHQAGSGESNRVADIRPGHEGETLNFSIGAGRGNALPARPFVGMSDDAYESFITIFDMWFDEAVNVVIHPKSGVMQTRGTAGRFGKKIN